MTGLPDNTRWCTGEVTESVVLIDGAEYFRALYRAGAKAQRSLVVMAWQFDPQIELIRGDFAEPRPYPVALFDFLNALCESKPDLKVNILAWDYSFVYAFERTWLQTAEARIFAHPRLQFRWRSHSDPRGSHHQKLVVVDGQLAFVGGLDPGNARWDTSDHALDNPHRTDAWGHTCKPFHDVQVAVRGPVVERLQALFWDEWRRADLGQRDAVSTSTSGERVPFDMAGVFPEELPRLPGSSVAVSRTHSPRGDGEGVREVLRMYQLLIGGARQLIYIETQYFTSSEVSRALIARMSRRELPALQIVIVMPDGADSPKERFALGKRQEYVLSALCSGAKRFGHELRVLFSAPDEREGAGVATYIHSKLMIVDDIAITLGSANLTNRSMGLDTELNLTWNAERHEAIGASRQLARLRARLLAEHAGSSDTKQFVDPEGLVARLDQLCGQKDCKLQRREIASVDESDPLISALFDPTTAMQHQDWDRIWEEVLGLNDEGLLKRSWEALKGLLS